MRSSFIESLEPRQFLTATGVYAYSLEGDAGWHTAFGITATWTGTPQSADPSEGLTATNTSFTLTLSDVPAHATIGATLVLYNATNNDMADDQDTVTISIAGQQTFSGNALASDYSIGSRAQIPHTGGTVVLVISGSGFESEDVVNLGDIGIGVYLPTVWVNSETILVGQSSEVTVTATDDFGPVSGVELDVESLNSAIIDAQQTSVTTGQNGTATVDALGVAAGTAGLKATTSNGQSATAQQTVIAGEKIGGTNVTINTATSTKGVSDVTHTAVNNNNAQALSYQITSVTGQGAGAVGALNAGGSLTITKQTLSPTNGVTNVEFTWTAGAAGAPPANGWNFAVTLQCDTDPSLKCTIIITVK